MFEAKDDLVGRRSSREDYCGSVKVLDLVSLKYDDDATDATIFNVQAPSFHLRKSHLVEPGLADN